MFLNVQNLSIYIWLLIIHVASANSGRMELPNSRFQYEVMLRLKAASVIHFIQTATCLKGVLQILERKLSLFSWTSADSHIIHLLHVFHRKQFTETIFLHGKLLQLFSHHLTQVTDIYFLSVYCSVAATIWHSCFTRNCKSALPCKLIPYCTKTEWVLKSVLIVLHQNCMCYDSKELRSPQMLMRAGERTFSWWGMADVVRLFWHMHTKEFITSCNLALCISSFFIWYFGYLILFIFLFNSYFFIHDQFWIFFQIMSLGKQFGREKIKGNERSFDTSAIKG